MPSKKCFKNSMLKKNLIKLNINANIIKGTLLFKILLTTFALINKKCIIKL